jgi:hypothetical protein
VERSSPNESLDLARARKRDRAQLRAVAGAGLLRLVELLISTEAIRI